MHTFVGKNGTTFHFHSDLSEVVIEDQEGNVVRSEDIEEFFELIRQRQLEVLLDDNDLGESTGLV